MIDDNVGFKTCSLVDKVTAIDSGHRRRIIKELPLPTYRGDIAEWRTFWQRFKVMDDEFSDDESLSYLLDCLKESTARAIVH